MSFMTKIKSGAAVAVVALAMTAGASAAATLGSIPGSASRPNDGLIPIYGGGTTSVQGWNAASLFVVGSDGTAKITATYHGKEAGFLNKFTLLGNTIEATQFGWSVPGFQTIMTGNNVVNGLLDFFFTVNNGPTTVANGSSNDGIASFFITFKPSTGETAGTGKVVDLWFDDSGAGPDDNHDDMLMRLTIEGGEFTVVPVPASIPLLLTALGGLGIVARRRAKKA